MRFGLMVLVLGLSLACAGVDNPMVSAGPPRGADPVELDEPDLSVLSMPVVVPYGVLEAAVQDRLPEVLVDDQLEPQKNIRVDLKVRRPMAVSFGANEGALAMTLPLAIEADLVRKRAAARRERLGKDPKTMATLTAGLQLDITTAYTLSPDWKLVPDVTVTPTWTEPAVLKVGPFTFDVTEKISESLDEKVADIETQVEARMAEQGDLRPKMAAAWADLSEPRPTEDGKSWMVIEPVALHASAPRAEERGLVLDVGFTGRMRMVTGERPTVKAAPPLPPPSDPATGGLSLDLLAELEWEALSAQASEGLADAAWPLEVEGVGNAGTLSITDVQLYPSGDKLAIGLEYATESEVWATEGTLWMLARPELGDDRSVELVDFDYAVQSTDWAAAPVNAELLRGQIRASAEGALVFPYGEKLDAKVAEANAELAGKQTDKGTVFSGELTDVSLEEVVLTDHALAVRMKARGTGSLAVTELQR